MSRNSSTRVEVNDMADLSIPERPITPCDGRAQQYRRPGAALTQTTKGWQNGTTITYGPQDYVPPFEAGDAFHGQVVVIEAAEDSIRSYRKAHFRGNWAPPSVADESSEELSQSNAGPSDWSRSTRLHRSDVENETQSSRSVSSAPSSNFIQAGRGRGRHAAGSTGRPARRGAGRTHRIKVPGVHGNRSGMPKASQGAPNTFQAHQSRNFPSAERGGGLPKSAAGQNTAGIGNGNATIMDLPGPARPGGVTQGISNLGIFGDHQFGPNVENRPPGDIPSHLPRLQLPPQQWYGPGLSGEQMFEFDIMRWETLMEEVLCVPRRAGDSGPPCTWYRIFANHNPRRELVYHPDVVDLPGPASQYESLLVRDVNRANYNNKGVGRENAPGQQQVHGLGIAGLGEGAGGGPQVMHSRQGSDDTSVFFREDNHGRRAQGWEAEYVGYNIAGEIYNPPSRERPRTPTPNRRGRTRDRSVLTDDKVKADERRSSQGRARRVRQPSTDSLYFGPPTIGGKSFNEAIGFVRPGSEGSPSK